MTLRILHLVSYPIYSGPLPSTLGLALAQREKGHRVHLACDTKRGAFNDFEEAALPRLRGTGLQPPIELTLSTKSSPIEWLRDLSRLRELSKDLDVLHLHMSHDHGLAALASGPLRIRTFHAERSLRRRFGQSWLNHRADGWIVRSRAHAETFAQRFNLTADVIAGGIDAGAFTPAREGERAAARQRFDLDPSLPVVAQVALIDGRGQEELCDAVAIVNRAMQILFVGRGEREEALRRRVARAGMEPQQVRFAGYLQGEDLLAAYAAADAVFVAQPGNDASARAALEGMACGLPLLAVRTGALAELVNDEVGYPVLSREPALVAAAIRSWLDDLNGGRKRGACGRQYVATERSFGREAEATLALYQWLVECRHS